jgi:preprotein translocase SecE subunit
VSAFFRELFRTGLYKRNQGRISRQVTFAAMAITVVLGLYSLSQSMIGVDVALVAARPAMVTYVGNDGHPRANATIKISGEGTATIAVTTGQTLEDIARAIAEQSDTTGVTARADDNTLTLASKKVGSRARLKVSVQEGVFDVEGAGDDGIARGREAVNAGLRFAVPGLLLFGGLWVSYRAVNVPGCADFLIAVEAEMNKVSWPTRHELFRGSAVVLVTILSLAAVLFLFDFVWGWIFHNVLKIM